MKRRVKRALIALALIALLVPLFAAFEAHTVNVKAHIENALRVTPKEMDFGIVFPQERFDGEFCVHLSDSFLQQERVTDVFYKLVQKRKPKTPSDTLDVVFAFDLSGSMGGALADAQAQASAMMAALSLVGPDVKFGVISHVDYPQAYADYHGYSNTYGTAATGDYAYKLDHPLDSNQVAVAGTIGALTTYNGADLPQNYTRIIYESYADPGIGWRAGAQQIVIVFGDDVPHDDNLEAGISGGSWTTGGDPGRNEIAEPDGSGDDLDLQTELANFAAAGKKLYTVHYGGYLDYWEYWTALTGGAAVTATGAGDIVTAIEDLFFYEDLRPYLRKAKAANDWDPDTEAAAVLGNPWTDPAGNEYRDIEDCWQLNFYVPCIVGAVGQDYVGPIAPAEADYGADVWVEVTGFSYAP